MRTYISTNDNIQKKKPQTSKVIFPIGLPLTLMERKTCGRTVNASATEFTRTALPSTPTRRMATGVRFRLRSAPAGFTGVCASSSFGAPGVAFVTCRMFGGAVGAAGAVSAAGAAGEGTLST